MLESQLIAGLYNDEHRQRIIIDGEKNPTARQNERLRNDKHKLCRECFEKTKTKKCKCGAKILPNKDSCFACTKKNQGPKQDQVLVEELVI